MRPDTFTPCFRHTVTDEFRALRDDPRVRRSALANACVDLLPLAVVGLLVVWGPEAVRSAPRAVDTAEHVLQSAPSGIHTARQGLRTAAYVVGALFR
jgi:hypothetical protein